MAEKSNHDRATVPRIAFRFCSYVGDVTIYYVALEP